MGGTGRTAMDAGADGMVVGRRRWVRSRRMRLGCMTCTGTYGSGWRTAGTRVTTERRGTGVRGSRGIAAGGCCAAVPGSTSRGTSALRTATGAPPATGASSTGSALPGRSRHESFPLSGERRFVARAGVRRQGAMTPEQGCAAIPAARASNRRDSAAEADGARGGGIATPGASGEAGMARERRPGDRGSRPAGSR